MKLTISAKPFTAVLKTVLPATAARSGLPILSGVRLEASDEGLVIDATDPELTVRRVIRSDVHVEVTGSVVVPAKTLAKAAAAMGEPDIVLECVSNGDRANLDVRSGNRTVTLQGFPVVDWPAFPRVAEIGAIASVDAQAIADAFERVAPCASGDETRPVLTTVALYFEEAPFIEFVATDSYRLGAVRVPVVAGLRVSDGPLLVPARGIRLLAKQLKAVREVVQIHALELSGGEPSRASRVAFSLPDTEWTIRTVEGEFPNWRQVVPEPTGGLLEFDSEELRSALRAVASVRSTTGAPVRLMLDDLCSMTVSEPGVGEMQQVLAEANFSPNGGGPMQIAFNPGYLADAIAFCGAERGRMWVRDPIKPVLFEGIDRRHALMPVRMP